MLERVIEEQARGDPAKAEAVRAVARRADRRRPRERASRARRRRRGVKEALIAQGAWSQYLEVGIGPDAEIFTKAQPMSAVGIGAEIGIHPKSEWNNPGAGDRAGREQPRRDRRRDARQRRQPARLRGPQRAAARQGQGQQRVLRDRPVHPPVRRALRHRRRAPLRARDARRRPGGLRARRRELDGEDQPRPARSRRATRSARTTSIRTGSCCSSARCSRRPRTGSGPGRASPTRSATSSRSRRRSWARSSTASTTPTRSRRGPSAPAR